MIPLTVRSHYSLMWGVGSVKALCRRARRLGYDRLALTDTDNLYGLWPFLRACRHEGITPIVGAEITDPTGGHRAVCLVKDAGGYANLCRLLTRRHTTRDFALETGLPARAAGLTVLTRDAGLLAAWHAAGVDVAAAMPRRPLAAGHRLRQAAGRLGVPVVATPGSFFLSPDDVRVHRLLRAIDGNTALSRLTPSDVAPNDAWLAGPGAYARRFAPCSETVAATRRLAEGLAFTGPEFGLVLPPLSAGESGQPEDALRRAAYAGARRRYGLDLPEPVVDRLEHELGIISRMGFCAYFLIVRDIVERSLRTCGRGSGAASLVAYCLGVTNVCPIRHNLYFERFLNPGRSDAPDIDVDFAWDERDDVLAAVLGQYGERAAMVCNHVCFRPKMAIREVAKVYGLTDAEIGRVSRRLPWLWRLDTAGTDLLAELRQRPEMRDLEFPPPWPEIIGLAQRIVGAPRYLSVHPGGVIITPGPIDAYVPVENAPKGVPIIQWEKDSAEDAGLVKIDLLGNRSLGVIRDALANLTANGVAFDEAAWEPEEDYATQEALAQGRTMGCFYIESPAMRLLQQKAGVGDFEHLVVHSSIIRPAANEFIREYIRRLHGGAWDPIHPCLADVLGETFGIMVYQEDVSRTAVALAGFSHAEADGLRKIMSKKDREHEIRDYRDRFVAGARSRGVADLEIDKVWDMIMSFSGYSFCKPHSASYARVSFQAAYLKTHFPAEFMAAVISNQGGFYSTFAYVSEARRMGLTIRPPDVNRSEFRWTGRGAALRVGLLSVAGLSAGIRAGIVSGRKQTPYAGLADFFDRVRPDEGSARALIHSGALDSLGAPGSRAARLWAYGRWQAAAARRPFAPRSLFKASAEELPVPPLPPEVPLARLRREFAVLGFVCACHPMTLYADALSKIGTVKAADLPPRVGRRVSFGGWLVTGKVVHTKSGDPMEFLTFEDETGVVETTFFPAVYHRFCHMVDRGRPYLLNGTVEQDWGATTLTVDRVEALARLPSC